MRSEQVANHGVLILRGQQTIWNQGMREEATQAADIIAMIFMKLCDTQPVLDAFRWLSNTQASMDSIFGTKKHYEEGQRKARLHRKETTYVYTIGGMQ